MKGSGLSRKGSVRHWLVEPAHLRDDLVVDVVQRGQPRTYRCCYSVDTPSPVLLEHLMKEEGVQQNDSTGIG